MPVEDHEVHAKTKQQSAKYEACQTKVRETHYYKRITYFPSDWGSPEPPFDLWEQVGDQSSWECRYMDYETDHGCEGCPQPKDMEYIEKMRLVK